MNGDHGKARIWRLIWKFLKDRHKADHNLIELTTILDQCQGSWSIMCSFAWWWCESKLFLCRIDILKELNIYPDKTIASQNPHVRIIPLKNSSFDLKKWTTEYCNSFSLLVTFFLVAIQATGWELDIFFALKPNNTWVEWRVHNSLCSYGLFASFLSLVLFFPSILMCLTHIIEMIIECLQRCLVFFFFLET